MARPRTPRALRRDTRLQVGCDPGMVEDLARIADGWDVPTATAAYWLLAGLLADLRGERVSMVGDPLSERAARWMRDRLAETPADLLGTAPATDSPPRT